MGFVAALVNFQRVVGRCLQTPVREFRNAAGRRVWLVGLVHNGERRYFEQLRTVVEELRAGGAAVHYESTGMSAQQREAANPSELEQEASALTSSIGATRLEMLGDWGWVDQLDGFGARRPGSPEVACWPDGWEHHDLPLHELLRPQDVEARVAELRATDAELKAVAASPPRRMQYLTDLAYVAWSDANGYRAAKPTDEIMLDRRNDKAIHDAQAVPGDVVLLWGATHLCGQGQLLRDLGYTMTGETWYTVGQLPHPALVKLTIVASHIAALRGALRGFRLVRTPQPPQTAEPEPAEVAAAPAVRS